MAEPPVEKEALRAGDWDQAADWILQEKTRRKRERHDMEQRWEEIDRQLAMTPARMRSTANELKWLPKIELPDQAQTLEVLTADARRLMFPSDREWFTAKGSLATEDERARLDFASYVRDRMNPMAEAVDRMGVQTFANVCIQRFLEWIHERYDFRGTWDLLNAEAFKYSAFVGRLRLVDHPLFLNESRGVKEKSVVYPALIACSIKDVYLDDAISKVMNEGIVVEPAIIRAFKMNVHDLALAARRGSKVDDEKQGWRKAEIAALEGDKNDDIEVIEQEGDFLLPSRSSGERALYVPNCIVTVAVSGRGSPTVIRYRERKYPFSSYIYGTYHPEHVDSPYASSPLMKGYPVQKAMTDAFNKLMAAAALNVRPPIRYDPYDHKLAGQGGPLIEPGAMWDSSTKPEPVEIGDVAALAAVVQMLFDKYADVSGSTRPRLGAQTKSHQTRGAVDSEITRGLSRTVDYVQSTQSNAMRAFLHKEYAMAREIGEQPIALSEEKGFILFSGKQLPDHVQFDITGAGEPFEERERDMKFMEAMKALIQLEPLARQIGATPADMDAIRNGIMALGGIVDKEKYVPRGANSGVAAMPAGPQGRPGLVPINGGAA